MELKTTLPLYNHLIDVRDAHEGELEGLPVADQDPAPFVRLHKDTVHVCGGIEHHGIPLEAYRDWLVVHKDDDAALDPIVCIFHSRAVEVNVPALKKGETELKKLFTVHNRDAFIQRDSDGKHIVPLSLLDVGRIYHAHYREKNKPAHIGRPFGGHHSKRALEALDHFLENVIGLKANHLLIASRGGDLRQAPKGDVP